MSMSKETKLISGIILLTLPTIIYGGVTLLGILTDGSAGLTAGGLELSETQYALWRAGHAHAGVLVILSLILQLFLDATHLPGSLRWTARIAAPVAAIAVSGGFFGLSFMSGFRWLLYAGILGLIVAVVITGVGLLRGLSSSS